MDELVHISPIQASILVVALPFIAFLLQAILGKRSTSGILSLIAICGSTILSAFFVFAPIWQQSPQTLTLDWFTIGNAQFTIGVLLNNLSVLMQFIVCIIALPVHIYSKSYMKGDPGIHRYWMYLSLFCFAMLGLTISKNLFMMYIFWELVGFASYLLIGFWFTREAAVQANKKAFIINRIGDLGFLIGIALVFSTLGTLDLVDLFGEQGLFMQGIEKNTGIWTVAGICFFVGAMAKSAQFPLHVWLPDAMEGPTSVSSLIHAATMVAAGVFLLASIFPLFNEVVLLMIAIIGTITAVSSAYIALGQYDIKKVLAFSTVSQLGFMMVAVGIGAWDAAMFHLVTHAFFKCLLFLGAGAVIHAMATVRQHGSPEIDPQDLRNMGGLRKVMPKTFALMSIAALALAGFPLTAGFLSKDAIIISALEWAMAGHGFRIVIPLILLAVSVMTAFYIGRVIFKTFFGPLRLSKSQENLLHEAPISMWAPMGFLAIGSLFFIYSIHPFSYEYAPILQGLAVTKTYASIPSFHLIVPVLLSAATLAVWWLGWRWYVQEKYPIPPNALLAASENQLGLDKFYQRSIVKGTLALAQALSVFDKYVVDGIVHFTANLTRQLSIAVHWIDKYFVDGLVNMVAGTVYYMGHLLRWVQNGRVQNYLGFAFTVVLIGIIYLILR